MSKELKVGIIAILIIVLGIWGFNFLKGENLFNTSSRYFKAEYDNVEGLSTASMITVNGMNVGKVTDIKLHPEKVGKVLVFFTVTNDIEFSKKSIAKMYSAGLMGGQNIAIVPKYDGEKAKSGDVLPSIKEGGLMDSVTGKLAPIQAKLDDVLVNADSLLLGMNQILDERARKSLNRSVISLEGTISDVRKTLQSVNGLVGNSKESMEAALINTKNITSNFSKISTDLAKTDMSKTVAKLETTLGNVNTLLSNIKSGKGSLGKLMTDDKMYTNLTNASKEMEELLREMKLNPKRFVHFSLFGKRPKPYNQDNNKNNTSN